MGVAGTNSLRLIAFFLALLAAGCGSSSADTDNAVAAGASASPAPSSSVIPQAQNSSDLIIGDISNSLQGFANKAPKQLETLYRVLLRNSISPQLAKMPGDNSPAQELGLQEVRMF